MSDGSETSALYESSSSCMSQVVQDFSLPPVLNLAFA